MMRCTIRIIWCAAILAVTSSLLWQTDGNAQAWPNEPAGSSLLLDCGWNTVLCNGALYDEFNSGQTTTLSTTPFSQPSVLENRLPGTSTGGGAQIGMNFGSAKPEVYFGVWWKMNAGFAGFPSNINKMFFTNYQAVGNNFYFGFYGPTNASAFTWYFDSQSYVESGPPIDNSHLSNTYGGTIHFGNGCSVSRETWYRIEGYLKRSSTATSRDGIVRWWINGQLCGNYTNVNLPGGTERWEINHTWDGGTPNDGWKTQDMTHWFDHVHISMPNGGGNTSNTDVTPPAPPTSLRVQ